MNLQSMSHQGALTKIAVFKGKQIRKVIYNNEWWFSVIDVVEALTETERPRKYWSDLKKKLTQEGYVQLSEKIGQLKLRASDGKEYLTDCANTEILFRIIQTIPSPKAEPFKRWLAKVGYERIQEIEDPELAMKRQNLRDHMTDLELIFSMLGEASTTKIARSRNAQGFDPNKQAAIEGGCVAGNARKDLEQKSGDTVVSPKNYLTTPQKKKILK